MANVEKQRERLITLLGDLFQLNQPDLDFGFYRIMHAKADRVSSFLQNDLLKIIKDAFGEADGKRVEEARLAYEAAVKQAKEFGAPNPEETEPVKKAKAAYDALKDAGNGEGEVYDHLFRFFERYYDNGDFMSRRYYARETDGKAAPYSIPYDGREVYLHWANRDQYYIKTSEYLTNFTFNLANAPELKGLFEQEERKVHCRIVDAAEGEHGNVKTTDKTERYFLIRKDEPIKIENGDLVIQFEYRPDTEKSGQGGKWQEKRIEEAEKAVLEALNVGELSRRFDTILRELIHANIQGEIKLDGKGLNLKVELGGERSTAAIDSLKVVAFDLSVLTLTMEGKTYLPAFLLHDSPREADLGASIYGHLFEVAKRLENTGPSPLFQYIVTTTTEPPEDCRAEPWLRLTIHGSPAADRLLKTDL